MTTPYSTGTITLTNGSASVVGTGTAWAVSLIIGGTIYVQAAGNPLPIASVDDDTHITSALEWTGATGDYSYALVRDTSYGTQQVANANTLTQLIAELRAGTIFKYDASGSLAGRATYDLRPAGFAYLVSAGVDEPILYVKASATSGDWSGPFAYGTGPTGPSPSLAIGDVETGDTGDAAEASITGSNPNYLLNLTLPRGPQGFQGWTIEPELVVDGARTVLRVASFIGGAGASPGGVGLYVGSTGLVVNIADAVDVRGAIGSQGPRGVQWQGVWSSLTTYHLGDLAQANDLSGNAAVWISLTTNTNSVPNTHPADWAFFPGSFPAVLDYGDFHTVATSSNDYGAFH